MLLGQTVRVCMAWFVPISYDQAVFPCVRTGNQKNVVDELLLWTYGIMFPFNPHESNVQIIVPMELHMCEVSA